MILPPNLNSLHSYSFGLLRLHLHSHTLSQISPTFSYRFLGQTQDNRLLMNSPISYDIYCSLWHFHMYLLDVTNLIITVSDLNQEIGRATIDIRKLIPRKLTNNVRNLLNDRRNYDIQHESTIVGSLSLSISTVFDQKLIQLCRPIAQKMQEMPQDSILDMMGDMEMPKTPRPIDKSPQPILPQQMSIDEQSKMISDDIDRMVAELQSKQYDSSKYQDEETGTMGSLMIHKQPIVIKPRMQASQYSIGKPISTNYDMMSTKAIKMEMPGSTTWMPQVSHAPMMPLDRSIQQSVMLPKTQTTTPKILKVEIFQLSFSSASFNQQLLSTLSTAKLCMTLPNQQQMSFVGKIHGQTVSYNCKNIQIQTVMTTTNTGTLLFNSQQPITFTIIEQFTLNELSYGTFNIQRLIRADNKGVFVIAMNNRQKTPNISYPPSEFHRLKPVNASLYSLRVGMELQSTTKNKLYQILLQINSLSQQHRIRYKMYGSQETVEAENDHIMVMPVMLDTILQDKNCKLIIEVWKKQTLLGLVDVSLSQIQKCLVRQDGKVDEAALLASIYPLYLCKGKQDIRHIISKKTEGTVDMSVCFGSPKQIGMVVKDRGRVVQPVIQEKKMVLPYNEQMGVFVKKQKGKEVQVQVELKEVREAKVETRMSKEAMVQNHKDIKTFYEQKPQNKPKPQQLPQPAISTPQESIISILQQPKHIENIPTAITPPIVPISLTSQLILKITHLIQTILSINPHFIDDLKKQIQKYLLFSFIQQSILTQCLHNLHLDTQSINELMRYLPITVQSTMLSINPLYDYFTSYSIHHTILQKFISDDILGIWIMEQYVKQNSEYLTDVDDIKHLTLRQKQVFWKVYRKNIKSESDWNKYYDQTIQNLQLKQQQNQIKQYQDNKILDAIYAVCQQSMQKHNIFNITIKGYDNCIESAKCLLNIHTHNNKIKITIAQHILQFVEDTSQEIQVGSGRQWFQHKQAMLELYSSGKLISSLTVQLERLVFQDIDGTYAMKTKQGSFCGLIRLSLQYIQ